MTNQSTLGADVVVPSLRDAIGACLNDAMSSAVANGANSVSMPDHLVQVAAWLAGLSAHQITTDEHTSFEAVFKEWPYEWAETRFERDGTNGYFDVDVHFCWCAWQARAALSTPMSPQEPVATSFSEDWWYDLASRHATKDWNSNGYLAAVKALVLDALNAAPMSGGVGALSTWNNDKQSALNDWFLSLPEGRRDALLKGDRWALAGAAFEAALQAPTEEADDKGAVTYLRAAAGLHPWQAWEICGPEDGNGRPVFFATPAHPVPASPAVEVASESRFPLPGEWVEWVEPYGKHNEAVHMRMTYEDVARLRRRDEPRYANDQEAVDDFCVVHWARAALVNTPPALAAVTEVAHCDFCGGTDHREVDCLDPHRPEDERAKRMAAPHPAVAVPAGLSDERQQFEEWIVREAGPAAIKRWLGTEGYENDRVQDYRTGWVACLDALAATSTTAPESVERQDLIDWAVGRWHAEVANRPLVNVHRRTLDDTWRQVLRHLDVNDRGCLGPTHDELLAAPKEGEA